jgi:hypothetical protein
MTPKQLIRHFGSQAETYKALGVSANAVSKWYIAGKVPRGRQFEISARFPALQVDADLSSGKPCGAEREVILFVKQLRRGGWTLEEITAVLKKLVAFK